MVLWDFFFLNRKVSQIWIQTVYTSEFCVEKPAKALELFFYYYCIVVVLQKYKLKIVFKELLTLGWECF